MVEAGEQYSQHDFLFLLLGARGHINMSKMSVNTEYELLAWLLSAWLEPHRAPTQLLFLKTLECKKEKCQLSLYFIDVRCQIYKQVVSQFDAFSGIK